MTAYWVGDVPAEDLVIVPARSPDEPIDLGPFGDVDLQLRQPDGTLVPSAGELLGSIEDDTVVIEWPDASPFADQTGIYDLTVILLGAGAVQQRCAPYRIIVQADDGWYALEQAREDWRGAPDEDVTLYRLLAGARVDVVTYEALDPEDEDYDPDARPRLGLRDAQLAQARNRWNAVLVDPNGQIADDALSIRPFPLDWHVKQMIRPESPLPAVY